MLAGTLLSAEWQNGTGFRSIELAPPQGARTGFTLQPEAQTGVRFTNLLALDRHLTNQIYLNGSGVAAGDVDGDGLVDLYFCRLGGPNALYRNLGGWRFEDITDRAGVGCAGLDSSSTVLADVDGDGDLDLLVSSVGGGTHLFLNGGKGGFTPSGFGLLNGNSGATSMAMADLDGDGTLDLYIANYRTVTLRDQPNTAFKLRMVNGQPEVSSINGRAITEPDLINRFEFKIVGGSQRGSFSTDENGEPDAIYLNDGHGRFSALSFTNGAFLDEDGRSLAKPPFDWGLSVMLRDLNGDSLPDIYVCNDFKSPDRVWLNDGRGRFRALPRTALRQTSLSSMGVDVADINRDGHFDLFVVDMLSREHSHRMTQRGEVNPGQLPVGDTSSRMQTPRNTLQLSRGDGTFAEIAQFAGLPAAEWAWTPAFLDVDLDGYEDLLISNGFERDGMNADVLRDIEARKTAQKLSSIEQLGLRRLFPRLDTPNAAFRNLGGLRFADVSEAWGFNARAVSQGLALADLDNDGDLDVVINNFNGPATLYRNDSPAPRVAVRLKGNAPNTRGIGAKITVTGSPVIQSQEMICGGRYLSSDDAMRVFAAGSLTNQLRIEVVWRSGKKSLLSDARPNHLYVIEEAGVEAPKPDVQRPPVPTLFQDVSSLLSHRHTEELFEDFARQPLLPYRLSQPGPGVSWFDVDGDGREDLIIASGRGGRTGVFLNQTNGSWKRMDRAPFDTESARDQTVVLGWRRSSNDVVLLAGSSNYEDGSGQGSVVRQFDLATGRVTDSLPGAASSTGPLALADVDGDGALDLFVGGRVLPGKYPEPASSLLFRSGKSGAILDDETAKVLAGVGLVNGAVFSDIDGDGDPDLVLACDWGPLKIFRNEHGKLSPWNPRLTGEALNPQLSTLNTLTGWWNGIATGDFDGDGRIDWVASNWGENTRHEMFRAQPLRLYHGDFDGDGVVETIEAHYEPSLKTYAPSRNLEAMLRGMPWLRPRFPTWKAFSQAGLEQMLGDRLTMAKVLEANWLATTVFLNRGDHFHAVRLPDEAQFSPVFGISVADFDGDGAEDIFLAQNFFAAASDTSRQDAGRGLLVRGDGRGGFRAVPGQESGLVMYGEQRGAAVADYDGDGRVDLCVGQNGAETKLYHNERALPGLRVRLEGASQNLSAIGAVLRPVFANGRMGAARELHVGSGWLSQDSAVSVLAAPEPVKAISIRWPGGKTTQVEIAPGAREVTVRAATSK